MEFTIKSFIPITFLVLMCQPALARENTDEYFLPETNVTLNEARNLCRSFGGYLLAGNMVDEKKSVKKYMDTEGINQTWLNITSSPTEKFNSVRTRQIYQDNSADDLGKNCKAVKWNNPPELKNINCYEDTVTGFLCHISGCSICPTWSCHNLGKGCLIKRYGAPTWYHARAACRAMGGDLWDTSGNSSINDAMNKMTMKFTQEFWIGLNAESWKFGTESSGTEQTFPSEVLFESRSDVSSDMTCFVLDMSSEPVWKPRPCHERAPAICVNKTEKRKDQQSTLPSDSLGSTDTDGRNGSTTNLEISQTGNITDEASDWHRTPSVKDREVMWIIIVASLGSTLFTTFVVICICICSRKRPKNAEEVFWAGNNMGEVPQWWTLKGPRIASEYAMPEGYYQDAEGRGPDADRQDFNHRAYFPGLEPNWTSPVAKSIEVLPSCHLEMGNQTFNTTGRHSRLIVSSKGYTEVERDFAKKAKLHYTSGNDQGKALYTAVWSRGQQLPENREVFGTQKGGYSSQNMIVEYDVPTEIAGQIPDDQTDDYFQPIGQEAEITYGVQEPEPVYFLPDSSGDVTKEFNICKSPNANIAQITLSPPKSSNTAIPIYTHPLQFKQQLGITSGSHFGSVPRLSNDGGSGGAVPEDNYDIPDKSIFATWRGKRGKPSPALFDTQIANSQAEELMKTNPPSRPPRTRHHLFIPPPVFIASPGSSEDVYEDMTGKRQKLKP